nr:Rdx family protein [Nocardioides alcanivorans]
MAAPRIEITYCTQCKWLLRAQWYAGELLQTFADEVGEVALVPATGECSGSTSTTPQCGTGSVTEASPRSPTSSVGYGT